jgi:hypothetical protein
MLKLFFAHFHMPKPAGKPYCQVFFFNPCPVILGESCGIIKNLVLNKNTISQRETLSQSTMPSRRGMPERRSTCRKSTDSLSLFLSPFLLRATATVALAPQRMVA